MLKNVCLVLNEALSSVTCITWKVGVLRNSFSRHTKIFTSEEAAEIVLIIVLYTFINFDLCILLLVTIIGLFMNDPNSLVSSTSHKKQLMSIK